MNRTLRWNKQNHSKSIRYVEYSRKRVYFSKWPSGHIWSPNWFKFHTNVCHATLSTLLRGFLNIFKTFRDIADFSFSIRHFFSQRVRNKFFLHLAQILVIRPLKHLFKYMHAKFQLATPNTFRVIQVSILKKCRFWLFLALFRDSLARDC